MELLIANPFFHPYQGGTEKMLFEVGRRLAKKHSVTVLTARLKGTASRDHLDGINVVRIPSIVFYSAPHPIPPPVPVMPGVERWLASEASNFDLVHINNRFIFSPQFGSIAAKNRKKLCLTIHNARPQGIDPLSDAFGSLFDDLIGKNLMRRCDGIAGVSDSALYSTIPDDFRGIKTTIYNGVDHWTFAPRRSGEWKEKLDIEGKMVLTNVRLIQQKGVPYLVEAMKSIDADLVVFGRGPLRPNLERQAKSLGVKAHFVNERLDDRGLASLYNSADCFVMPSLYDPCPLALLEGMGSGLPCVVTDAGGMKELVIHGKSGIVVPAADSRALSGAIKKVLGNRKLATSFGREARHRVLKYFTWEKVAQDYGRFYGAL